jgi:hypothetical protein
MVDCELARPVSLDFKLIDRHSQCEAMTAHYETCILLIEFEEDKFSLRVSQLYNPLADARHARMPAENQRVGMNQNELTPSNFNPSLFCSLSISHPSASSGLPQPTNQSKS